MLWWDPGREQRTWRREMKDVPLSQLRGNVERLLFYQNPRKQRWAKRYLWRQENLWRVDRVLIGILIALAGTIAGYLNWFSK
jgi:anti-sigma-K factor RskA